MLTRKSSDPVRTSRNIKGFRSCGHATAVAMQDLDRGRVLFAERRRIRRDARRRWLSRQWTGRFEGEAERMRVLPPSAASRQTMRRR
jgi:hypothetical protein